MLDKRTIWDAYTLAWKHHTAAEKHAALERVAARDCVYTDPLARTESRDALVEYMLEFHRQVPGGHFETSYFLAHHDRSIARWTMRGGDGAALGEGISYGEYDGDKLVAMTGFFEPR